MSKSGQPRSRNFCLVCYEEQIKDVMSYFKDYTNRGVIRCYYVIKHDPESEEKQIHFHCLVEYYDAKTLTAVSKKMGLREGLVEYCTDLRGYACYMIHKYEIDKKRYDPSLVETNDSVRYREIIYAENDNQISNDKIVFQKFAEMVENTNYPLFVILRILCSDKNITVKTVRSNTYLFKTYYESARREPINIKNGERRVNNEL